MVLDLWLKTVDNDPFREAANALRDYRAAPLNTGFVAPRAKKCAWHILTLARQVKMSCLLNWQMRERKKLCETDLLIEAFVKCKYGGVSHTGKLNNQTI